MTGPGDRDYDDALSSIRNGAEDLAVALAIWETRNEPDAYARRCASDAVDAIDAASASCTASAPGWSARSGTATTPAPRGLTRCCAAGEGNPHER